MNLGLTGAVALVTGGSKGIGAEIVRVLAGEGVRVAFCARPSPELDALALEVRAAGGDCAPFPADVLDSRAITDLTRKVAERFGGIDILVNNVGGAIKFAGFEELDDADWLAAFELNVMSVVRFTRASLPHLRASPIRRIINVSSISASQPGFYNPHYTAAKAAVVNLGKHLANVLAKDRILVNTVCAGPVHSDSWQRNVARVASDEAIDFDVAWERIEREESAKVPLGKVADPREIASIVAFLASPLSAWTTGACFRIDGGKNASAF